MELKKWKSLRVDTSSDPNLIYSGEASPWAEEDQPIWKIFRYDKSAWKLLYAIGTDQSTHKWSERTSLQYK